MRSRHNYKKKKIVLLLLLYSIGRQHIAARARATDSRSRMFSTHCSLCQKTRWPARGGNRRPKVRARIRFMFIICKYVICCVLLPALLWRCGLFGCARVQPCRRSPYPGHPARFGDAPSRASSTRTVASAAPRPCQLPVAASATLYAATVRSAVCLREHSPPHCCSPARRPLHSIDANIVLSRAVEHLHGLFRSVFSAVLVYTTNLV